MGGLFGLITQNVQFHATDDFESIEQLSNEMADGEILVNKRVRSLRFWKRAAKKNGLRYRKLIRTNCINSVLTPQNNVLVLSR